MGFPPLETREETLQALGRVDLFGTGVNPQQMDKMRQLEVRMHHRTIAKHAAPSSEGDANDMTRWHEMMAKTSMMRVEAVLCHHVYFRRSLGLEQSII